jgi:hypothetical protein
MISGHGLEVGGAVFFQNHPQRVARIAENEKAVRRTRHRAAVH